MWIVSYINSTTSLSCRNQLEREEEEEENEDYKIHEPLWKWLIKEQGAPRCTGEADERRCFTQDTMTDVEVHPHHAADVKQPQGFRSTDPNSWQATCWGPSLSWLIKNEHIWLRKSLSYKPLEAEEYSAVLLHACPPLIFPRHLFWLLLDTGYFARFQTLVSRDTKHLFIIWAADNN